MRVSGTLHQCLSGCFEEQGISNPLIDIKQFVQTRGYCENNVKMFYRGEISRKFIHPLHPFYVLAFGTIAITTRVIGLNLVTAMIATQCMPAKF